MDEENEEKRPAQQPQQDSYMGLNWKQRFYENFRGVPLKAIDAFIGLCILAFVLLIVIGLLRGGKF